MDIHLHPDDGRGGGTDTLPPRRSEVRPHGDRSRRDASLGGGEDRDEPNIVRGYD